MRGVLRELHPNGAYVDAPSNRGCIDKQQMPRLAPQSRMRKQSENLIRSGSYHSPVPSVCRPSSSTLEASGTPSVSRSSAALSDCTNTIAAAHQQLSALTRPSPAASEFASKTVSIQQLPSSALARFSTGGHFGIENPQIRLGWFKSPVRSVSMEELSFAHDQERFVVIDLEYAEAWKECHVDFCRGGIFTNPYLDVSSGMASVAGSLYSHGGNRITLFFPGFCPISLKLIFSTAGVTCGVAYERDAIRGFLRRALIRACPNTLPLGFDLKLKQKALTDLSAGERVARDYYTNVLAPSLGKGHDASAVMIERLLENGTPGMKVTAETFIPAVFDSRPGSRLVHLCLKGRANSATAPQFVELWQAPPGREMHVKRILLKKGDNPHQDRFALAMSRVFNHLWEREGVGVAVAGQARLIQNVLYGVLQSSVRTSVIEVVEGTSPVRNFHDRHSRLLAAIYGDRWWHGDLNDWTPSAALLASAAAAFTTAYVLEIGDRHQDNMLVTRDGQLFNIDFGFLLGDHPRFVDAQPFAVPVAFRTALVQNGSLWATFKAACARAFAALVKHREFVIFQALEVASSLGSHSLLMRATIFGKRLADPCVEVHRLLLERRLGTTLGLGESGGAVNTLDMLADVDLEIFVEAVGKEISRSIDRGVYGHQAKDLLHETRCVLM